MLSISLLYKKNCIEEFKYTTGKNFKASCATSAYFGFYLFVVILVDFFDFRVKLPLYKVAFFGKMTYRLTWRCVLLSIVKMSIHCSFYYVGSEYLHEDALARLLGRSRQVQLI